MQIGEIYELVITRSLSLYFNGKFNKDYLNMFNYFALSYVHLNTTSMHFFMIFFSPEVADSLTTAVFVSCLIKLGSCHSPISFQARMSWVPLMEFYFIGK